MEELILRWQRAAERADLERVRVLKVNGEYLATSTSRPLVAYHLRPSAEGWTCECVANGEYGVPCKHLWTLAEMLELDLLKDIRAGLPEQEAVQPAA